MTVSDPCCRCCPNTWQNWIRLQASDLKPVQVRRSKDRRDYDQLDEKGKREALAARIDASWRVITAGTVLDGSRHRRA